MQFIFQNLQEISAEDRALLLSNSWKTRASLIVKDFLRLKKTLQAQIEILTRSEKYEEVHKMVDEVCLIQVYVNELNEMTKTVDAYPLSHWNIQRISYLETEYYRFVMTKEVHDTLSEEVREEERMEKVSGEITEMVNTMWDDNKSEEDIKQYIYGILSRVYRRRSREELIQMSNTVYIQLTASKPVRVNLTDKQIARLKKMKGVFDINCGTCQDEIDKNDEVIVLPCNDKHVFHPDCIIPWLKRSVFCPLCKSDVRQFLK